MRLHLVRSVTLSCAIGLQIAVALRVAAQPLPFGSSDDPAEQIRQVWRTQQNSIDLLGGFSLIGPRWWAAGSANANILTRTVGIRLRSTLRVGLDTTLAGEGFGRNRPDYDEPYDLFRQIVFLRYHPPNPSGLYLRVGPILRGRLGTGHLVNFFNSTTAWDERTVGSEFMFRLRAFDIAALTDNILLDGIVGGRVAVRPLTWSEDPRARTLELGFNAVTDVSKGDEGHPILTGFNGDLSFAAALIGEARLAPYASFAWYEGHGSGLAAGAAFESENFLDVARFSLRLGVYYDSDEFYPGYVGSFYTIQNARARILDTENGSVSPERTAGVPLADVRSGNGYEFELRVVFFGRVEFWWQFRRRYGSQPLSERHVRLLFQTSRLRALLHQDRSGLRSFFSVFNDLGDQTSMTFEAEYLLRRRFWIVVRARYGYERVADAPDGTNLYLVQRRFEPLAGMRLRF